MSKIQSPGDDPTGNESVLGYARTAPPSAMAVLLCRILAIWMLAWGFYSATDMLGQLIRPMLEGQRFRAIEWLEYSIGLGLTTGVWIVFAWYCWTRAPALAQRMA